MFFSKLRTAAVGILAAGALAVGAAAVARQAPADPPAGVPPRGADGNAEKQRFDVVILGDKDDAFDRLEDLRLDIDFLMSEIDVLKTIINDLTKEKFFKSMGIVNLKSDTPKATEDLKLRASEEINAMSEGLQELRKNYDVKRMELTHKRKELEALQRSRRPEVDRHEPRGATHELERRITELNQKLDRVLKALEDSKHNRER